MESSEADSEGSSKPSVCTRRRACIGCCTCASFLVVALVTYGAIQALGPFDAIRPSAQPDVRVAKGFGTKAYNQVRISVITADSEAPRLSFFDYSSRFRYKWRQNYLHTALKAVSPGSPTSFNVGVANVTVRLPKQGDGAAGVLIADPCVNSPTGRVWIPCVFGTRFHTIRKIPELLNAFAGHTDTDFWGILGDNFYDRTGEITADFFGRLSVETKSKVFLTVAGNHDYWVSGTPSLSFTADQCANGHMQYYAQDAKSAEAVAAGSSDAPFDFSVDPDAGRPLGLLGCNLPALSNSFAYHQLGNVGFVTQSGAYKLDEARPFITEACGWLAKQETIDLVVLMGHWDTASQGASSDMAMPGWYDEVAKVPGCDEFDRRGALKFIVGHTHCNDPHPRGEQTGFRVAGFGMEGCGNFGVPVLDTTGGKARIWYFDTESEPNYETVLDCVRPKGWRACTHLATLWLDEALPKRSSKSSAPPVVKRRRLEEFADSSGDRARDGGDAAVLL